jgi:cell wall-associated NlpC family hydrolase
MTQSIVIRVVAIVVACGFTACSTTATRTLDKQTAQAPGTARPSSTSNPNLPVSPPVISATTSAKTNAESIAPPASSVGVISDLLIYALSLVGVQYRFGGNSVATGFDCSGYVRHVFSEVTARAPRQRAEDMSKVGISVAKEELAPGDLVFYNTSNRAYSHVGIYLGDARFVHSPSVGRAVEIVNMQDNYWARRYNGARRIELNAP